MATIDKLVYSAERSSALFKDYPVDTQDENPLMWALHSYLAEVQTL
jgi:hypothetical protein